MKKQVIEGYARSLDVKYFGKKRMATARFGIESVYSKKGTSELSYPGSNPFVKVRLTLETFDPQEPNNER